MINDTPSRFEYAGDGSTRVFPFPAAVVAPEYVRVRIDRNDGTEEELEFSLDYTVTLVQAGTAYLAHGEVELSASVAVPEDGETVTVYRRTPVNQNANFSNQGPYFASTTEFALDRAVATIQEIRDNAGMSGSGGASSAEIAQIRQDITDIQASKVDASDLRLTNARTPTAHAASHAVNGSDAITPASIGAVVSTDPRLSDSRTPTAHAASHGDGGSDALPKASASAFGVVKVDGTTITSSGGVLTAVGGGSGGEGTTNHAALINRDAADQHPQEAITGLTPRLAASDVAMQNVNTTLQTQGTTLQGLDGTVSLHSSKISLLDATATELRGLINARVEEAPQDGKQYARQNSGWSEVAAAGGVSQTDFDTAISGLNASLNNRFDRTKTTDLVALSGLGMPSSRYVSVTLPAHDGTYTAPANGYVVLRRITTAANQYVELKNKLTGLNTFCTAAITGYGIAVFLPVKTGTVVSTLYTAGTADLFRFIYAEGN